jgi:hypothetical protein
MQLQTWSYRRQPKVCPHHKVPRSSKLFDLPHKRRLIWCILHRARRRPKLWTIRIVRHRDVDFHIIGRAPPLELALDLDKVLDPAALVRLDSGLDPDEGLDGGGDPVGHQLELAVGRDEGDGAVGLEASEADTLVEFDIFHFDGFASGC